MVGRVYYMLFHDLFEPEMCVACVGEVEKGRGGGGGICTTHGDIYNYMSSLYVFFNSNDGSCCLQESTHIWLRLSSPQTY